MEGGSGRFGPAPSRGQTETIGVVLVLAMTLVGATVALGYGSFALNEARTASQEAGVENAMTQFDSRTAMVALGSSPTQNVRLGAAGSGTYRVDPNAGWINITHTNYDGNGSNEVLYNATLGALVYQRDDRKIVYQGGGVWTSTGNGSRMVSPPEFHYQSSTLTLLVFQLRGSGTQIGSGVTARVVEQGTRRLYPNTSASYPATGRPYQNPVRDGNVTVTIRSDFYAAWAEYFRTRTAGEVTVDHNRETVSVKLVSVGTLGEFEMPADGNSIELRGLADDHAITDFTITIQPDDTDSADFANLQWTLYAKKGSQKFEIHLRDGGKNDDTATPCTERDVEATVYYSDTNGNPYQAWNNASAFRTGCDDLDGDGDSETFLEVNLTGSTQLTYTSVSNSNLQHFSPGGETLEDPVTVDQHEDTVDWEGPTTEFTSGDERSIGDLTNHYLALLGPNVELTVEDKDSNTVNEDASHGTFEHTGGAGTFITFLHVSEHRISVDLN